MCGIHGFNWKSSDQIKRMIKASVHRGPDDSGIYLSDEISLGHNRLSIIDLSKKGHQPMTYKNLHIVYNGEIYNYKSLRKELQKHGYKFYSQTDTEVLLKAFHKFGPRILKRLNGMWAFAIYDEKKHQIFISRDRFGIKPLYYYYNSRNGTFIFSSEIKSILTFNIKRILNKKIANDFIFFELLNHTDETFFEGIKQLLPAHFMVFDLRKRKLVSIKKYYQFPKKIKYSSFEKAAKKLFELVIDAVKLRLQSDVPIGVMLSGGVDSSIVSYSIHSIKRSNISTYSSVYKDKRNIENELPKIAYLIKKYQIGKNYFTYPSFAGFISNLKTLVKIQEEPFLSPSIYAQWLVLKKARKKGSIVVLHGQGGDELFGGYYGVYKYYLKELAYKFRLKEFFETFWHLRNSNVPLREVLSGLIYVCLPKNLQKKLLELRISRYLGFIYNRRVDVERKFLQLDANDANEYMQKWVHFYNIPQLTHYDDKNSMCHSVETRVPLLDYRIVNLAFSIPTSFKIKNGYGKYILRYCFSRYLPREIIWSRIKVGFETPVRWLMSNKLLSYYKKQIEHSFALDGFINKEKLYLLIDKVKRNKNAEDAFILWRIMSLELWAKTFDVVVEQ